jgi:hypothetical protein
MTDSQSSKQYVSPPHLMEDLDDVAHHRNGGPTTYYLRRIAGQAKVEIAQLRQDCQVASDFMRACIKAVGYKEQPPDGFPLDTKALAAHVIGEIERWKVAQDETSPHPASVFQFVYATCSSGGGTQPKVTIGYRTLEEAQAVHNWLWSVQREGEQKAPPNLADAINCTCPYESRLTTLIVDPLCPVHSQNGS